MNELIFFAYILVIVISTTIALRMGKETLVGLICMQAILINLFVTKEIILFGFTATASDALAIGIMLGLNLLQEYYSYQLARRAIWSSFFCSVIYVFYALLHLAYQPSPTDTNNIYFHNLLSPMPRLVAASLIVYLIVQFIDSYIYRQLLIKFQNRYFILRNYTSLAFSQLLDTVLFSFLGLYGLNPSFSRISTIIEIIVISYIIKLTAIIIATPLLYITKQFVSKKSIS
jgi:queuosine precursor transporter